MSDSVPTPPADPKGRPTPGVNPVPEGKPDPAEFFRQYYAQRAEVPNGSTAPEVAAFLTRFGMGTGNTRQELGKIASQVRSALRKKPAGRKSSSATPRRKRLLVAGLALVIAGILVAFTIHYFLPRTETLRQAIARQLNRHPDQIQINLPPVPGLYPGAVIVHPSPDQLAVLKSQKSPDGLAGQEFFIKGAVGTDSSMTLHGKTDYLSQLISDSERFVTTIDLTNGRVLTKDLADLKKTVLEDPDILEAYRKGSNPEMVHLSYEAIPAITVRRRSSVSSEEWATVKKQALENKATLNEDDSTTFTSSKPVVIAIETVSVKYISNHLGPLDPNEKPADVELPEVIRQPGEQFRAPAPAWGRAQGAIRLSFACSCCGKYSNPDYFDLKGAEASSQVAALALEVTGGQPLLPVRTGPYLTAKELLDSLPDIQAALRRERPDVFVYYHMGHAASTGFGRLNLVLSDCASKLPEEKDYALVRAAMDKGRFGNKGLAELFDTATELEAKVPAETPGLVSVSTIYDALAETGVPFVLIIDGCYDRADMGALRDRLGFSPDGSYAGPQPTTAEDQLAYQRVMDSFGKVSYLRSQNVVILAAKPGSKAFIVDHPYYGWEFSPRIGPLAARLAGAVEAGRIWPEKTTWGRALASLVDWRGTGEVGFRGSVSWSDFSLINKLEQQRTAAPPANEQKKDQANLGELSKSGFTRPQPSPVPTSYFRAASSEGDSIGEGKEITYGGDKIRVQRTMDGVTVTLGDGDWDLELAGPAQTDLKAGLYEKAKRYPFNEGAPGLSFTGMGRGCNTIGGKFVVWEFETRGDEVTRLGVDFVQHCDENEPPLHGVVRYKSTLK